MNEYISSNFLIIYKMKIFISTQGFTEVEVTNRLIIFTKR